ncbi:glycosyltransferase family 4 protein [Paenibacillus solisilvae]|uniref:Glycosyltransferase family 4 protein n=1 Tax=Paenibacillus solisilvae TaxID=2486751 RepID=A0ABW0W271_9BACL
MTPNKILLVAGVFPPGIGGMQNYYYNLCKHSGHEITVLAPKYDGDEAFDADQPFTIIRGPFMKNESVDVRSWPRLFSYVRRMIRQESIEVTIYGYIMIGIIGLILKLLSGHRYAISTHGMDMLMFRRVWGLRFIVKQILRRADLILTNSEFTKKLVESYGVPASKIDLVHPGVESGYDIQAKSSELMHKHKLEDKYVLLSVGRLVLRKGHDRVIEAMPAIIQALPSALYLIVGEGPERKRLEQLSIQLGVSDYVVFVGSVHGSELLNEYYNVCDQFIMISRELAKGDAEGFGIVYLEAASAGIPVIAGNSGGVCEAVLDGVTGLLVDPQSTDEITEAVLTLQKDSQLREKLTRNGYKRAKSSFNYVVLAEKFDLSLHKLCSASSNAGRTGKVIFDQMKESGSASGRVR